MVIIPGLVKRERKIPAIFLAQILTISMDGPLKKCRKLLNYGRDFVLGCACVVWLWAILAKHEISLGNINLINLINLIVENFNITNRWTVGYFCRFFFFYVEYPFQLHSIQHVGDFSPNSTNIVGIKLEIFYRWNIGVI